MATIPVIRPSPIAGTWYSANPDRLAAQMDEFMHTFNPPEIKGDIFGLVVPHAGHRYSGTTAGAAYRTILGKSYSLVIILSPSHHYYAAELLSSAHSYYATPLGKVPVHQESLKLVREELRKEGGELDLVAEDEEHSIEIQLPFLQCALKGDFALLPIMMLSQNEHTVQRLAAALEKAYHQFKPLVIASSDLSHFHPLEIAEKLDACMLEQITSGSPQNVLRAEKDGSGSACGAGPIATTLSLAKMAGATGVEVLKHSTSADATGDPSSVVGYGAAVIYFKPV